MKLSLRCPCDLRDNRRPKPGAAWHVDFCCRPHTFPFTGSYPRENNMARSKGKASQALAYMLTPQVLIGGFAGWMDTEAVDAYKIYRDETRADVVDLRGRLDGYINPLPQTSAETTLRIQGLETLYALYDFDSAHDFIARVIGMLHEILSRQTQEESARTQALEAERHAAELAARAVASREYTVGSVRRTVNQAVGSHLRSALPRESDRVWAINSRKPSLPFVAATWHANDLLVTPTQSFSSGLTLCSSQHPGASHRTIPSHIPPKGTAGLR
jgi:hypothetical protein